MHKDHLGGSSVITNETGDQIEVLDYYPYGLSRIDEKTSSFNDKHKYTGKELDSETGLYYYGQRYYDPTIGRFVSEDPMFWALTSKAVRLLADPQQLNSYSYARNNPLRYVDPNGESISLAGIASQLSSISSKVQALASSIQSFTSQARASVSNYIASDWQKMGSPEYQQKSFDAMRHGGMYLGEINGKDLTFFMGPSSMKFVGLGAGTKLLNPAININ